MMTDRIIEGKINSIQADLATRVKQKERLAAAIWQIGKIISWSVSHL